MANLEHLAMLEKGVEVWNQWRKEEPDVIPDLEGANLRNRNLNMIDFHKANLKQVDLYRASLCEANLRDAVFHMAHLYRTNFSNADLTRAMLKGADLVRAKLIGASLREADLRWVKLGEADLSNADLTSCAVYGVCAWDIKFENMKQSNLDITSDRTYTIIVDDLETAQLIHVLLDYKKIRNVINSVRKKSVLILGRFKDGGIDILKSIANKLREDYEYLPIIFDFDRPDTLTYTMTVQLLATLSKFVIVDLSGPSVPHELSSTIPHFQIPFVPIIDRKSGIYFLLRDFLHQYEWVLEPVEFIDEANLMHIMDTQIIERAEAKIKYLEYNHKYDEKMKNLEEINERDINIVLQIKESEIEKMQFQKFNKTAKLEARLLTEKDYRDRKGIINSLEGSIGFVPGDYLLRGVKNEEWSITQHHFHNSYEKISDPDEEGFAFYRAKDIRMACQMTQAFCVKRANGDILNGKIGDYLVKSGSKIWITNQHIFESTYEAVSC
jgi:uncharacterized protein YjbI with pentapeptide repeats